MPPRYQGSVKLLKYLQEFPSSSGETSRKIYADDCVVSPLPGGSEEVLPEFTENVARLGSAAEAGLFWV